MIENTAYIALSRQIAMRRQLDVIANNVANMNTTAFKGERLLFEEYLTATDDGQELSYVQDVSVMRDTTEGELVTTSNMLDLAISGPGYFVIGTDEGERYTRNGHFRTDADGVLVTDIGDPVLDEQGRPIVLDPGEKSLTVSRDGTIATSLGAAGKLNLVSFENEQMLLPEGNGLYKADESSPPLPFADGVVLQGMLESSNVIPIIEITSMIELSRAYQRTQDLLQRDDELRRRAVRDLAQAV